MCSNIQSLQRGRKLGNIVFVRLQCSLKTLYGKIGVGGHYDQLRKSGINIRPEGPTYIWRKVVRMRTLTRENVMRERREGKKTLAKCTQNKIGKCNCGKLNS